MLVHQRVNHAFAPESTLFRCWVLPSLLQAACTNGLFGTCHNGLAQAGKDWNGTIIWYWNLWWLSPPFWETHTYIHTCTYIHIISCMCVSTYIYIHMCVLMCSYSSLFIFIHSHSYLSYLFVFMNIYSNLFIVVHILCHSYLPINTCIKYIYIQTRRHDEAQAALRKGSLMFLGCGRPITGWFWSWWGHV